MGPNLRFHGPTNPSASVVTSGSSTNSKLGGRKTVSMVKDVCAEVMGVTANAFGVGPFNEISSLLSRLSAACKEVPEYAVEYSHLVKQLEIDCELMRQATPNLQTVVGGDTSTSLQAMLQDMLKKAEEIERLHPVSKRLNALEILGRIHELRDALHRCKTDITFKVVMASMTQTRAVVEDDPLLYEEVSWREISVTDSAIYQVEACDSSNRDLVCVKSISKAHYRNQTVCFIEYSGTVSRKKKHELLMQDLRQCITGRHANVLQLVGGATPSTATSHPYLVFEAGGQFDHVDFLRETTSLSALITFVRGVAGGSEYMFRQNVIYRDSISVSQTGVATVHPPGIKLSKLTGKQSTKRWAGHILGDVDSESKSTTLPLHEIYQILNACNSKKLKSQVEDTLMAFEGIPRKRQIFEIAEDLQVPLKHTSRYVSASSCPNFTISPGSFGTFTGDNSGKSQAPFTHWSPLTSQTLDLLYPRSCASDWMDKITTRVTVKDGPRPTFKDGDIPIMEQRMYPGWLSFENVMRNTKGLSSTCSVVLHYGTQPSKKFDEYQAAFDKFTERNDYPSRMVHFVRGINLRLIFDIEPGQIEAPIYLHRQPSSQSSRDYWGFLSQFADPTMPPASPVSDINIVYQIDVVTALDGDSWAVRGDTEHDQHEYAKIPGAWVM